MDTHQTYFYDNSFPGRSCNSYIYLREGSYKEKIMMKKSYNKTILIASLILLLAIILVHFLMPQKYSPTLLPVALVLFSGTSFLSFGIFQKILNRTPQQFINYYVAYSFLKMLVHLFVLLIMALIMRSEAVALILWYCILFAVYVAIETVFAFKMARKN